MLTKIDRGRIFESCFPCPLEDRLTTAVERFFHFLAWCIIVFKHDLKVPIYARFDTRRFLMHHKMHHEIIFHAPRNKISLLVDNIAEIVIHFLAISFGYISDLILINVLHYGAVMSPSSKVCQDNIRDVKDSSY